MGIKTKNNLNRKKFHMLRTILFVTAASIAIQNVEAVELTDLEKKSHAEKCPYEICSKKLAEVEKVSKADKKAGVACVKCSMNKKSEKCKKMAKKCDDLLKKLLKKANIAKKKGKFVLNCLKC